MMSCMWLDSHDLFVQTLFKKTEYDVYMFFIEQTIETMQTKIIVIIKNKIETRLKGFSYL